MKKTRKKWMSANEATRLFKIDFDAVQQSLSGRPLTVACLRKGVFQLKAGIPATGNRGASGGLDSRLNKRSNGKARGRS